MQGHGNPKTAQTPHQRSEGNASHDRKHQLWGGFSEVHDGEGHGLDQNGEWTEDVPRAKKHEAPPEVFPAHPIHREQAVI